MRVNGRLPGKLCMPHKERKTSKILPFLFSLKYAMIRTSILFETRRIYANLSENA